MSRYDQNIRKLVLGTAQFGLDYGISNKRGQIPQQEVEAILAAAIKAGVNTLDTAAAYGESEESIGKALGSETGRFRVISKFPPNTPDKSIKQAFGESLRRLRQQKLYGYLLHSFDTYSSDSSVLEQLLELKKANKVEKIGISLYHPHEAEELIRLNAAVDIVQFPYSVFDRRFEKVMPLLRQRGIETHVRSVYLQGLYFMQPEDIPASLQAAAPKIRTLQQLAKKYKLPLGALLLNFALSNPDITNVVVGVESISNLQENISYCKTEISEELIVELQQFEEQNEIIILPYLWSKA